MSVKAGTPLSPSAIALKQKLEDEKVKVEEIRANLTAVAETYDEALHDLDSMLKEVEASVMDDEGPFRDAIQGSKGTGLQENNHLVTLRQLRLTRDTSVRDLAEGIGIPFPHVSEIERGLRQMTPQEQEIFERWAGGRIYYRPVPYVWVKNNR